MVIWGLGQFSYNLLRCNLMWMGQNLCLSYGCVILDNFLSLKKGPITKNIHPSTPTHIKIKVLSMSHSIRSAAKGYIENRFSMHLYPVGHRQLCCTNWHQSDHVVQGLPFLVLGIGKFVIDLIQDMVQCKWPNNLSGRQQRTDVISPNPCFVVKQSVFHLCFWCHRSNGSWHGHWAGATAVMGCLVPTFL